MDFSDERIADFIAIWKEEFGETLTPNQARIEATRLMELYLLLGEPLSGEGGASESSGA
jgi:hypothetical protein